MREAQARPGPVHGVLDQPGADRIAEHVTEGREEMDVVLNRKTFEAALPHTWKIGMSIDLLKRPTCGLSMKEMGPWLDVHLDWFVCCFTSAMKSMTSPLNDKIRPLGSCR